LELRMSSNTLEENLRLQTNEKAKQI